MKRWLIVGLVLALALSLFAGVFGHGIAGAKSPKPQDQVKNFLNAVIGLKTSKAAGYWVTEERNNVVSQLSSIPSGTKISLSKLKLVVTGQTTDTAVVTATYDIKVKYKGKTQQGNEQDNFNLKNVSDTWLISSSTMWEHIAGMVVPTPTPKPGSAPSEVTKYARDWPLPNGDYSQTRATKNSSINSGNVNKLGVAWSFNMPGIGAYGGGTSNPIIMGKTVFFQDGKANVFAIDLQTGAVKWQKLYNTDKVVGPNGPALGYGKVFVAKDLYTIAALDMNTGKELWTNKLSNVATTGIDIQPSVYDGLVYVSTVPGTGDLFYAPGGMGIIYALDEKTGQIKWQFNTVYPDDLWGHPEINSGGGAWYSPAVDVNTGMIFWGIGNPAPFPGTDAWPNGSSRPGPNLYTDSMVVLDHNDGKLAWYKQVTPHDLLDHDFQISPILGTSSIGGGKPQEIVIGSGKAGDVYAFNRSTGDILWDVPVGVHNPAKQPDVLQSGTTTVIPGVLGGVETPMALGNNGVLYVPVVDLPSDWTPTKLDASTLDFSKGKGELVAINVNTGKIIWSKSFNSLNVGAATVVNDLVFTATYDGMIYAFKRDTGEQVWSHQAPAGINGWPAVAGDTIIWPAGVGGEPSLLAFRLGAKSPTPTVTLTPTPTPSATPPESANSVSISGFAFNPASLTVTVGTLVTWTNNDSVTHTVTSDTGVWDSGQIISGQTFSHTFNQTGTFSYHCSIHTNMVAKIVVQASSSPG